MRSVNLTYNPSMKEHKVSTKNKQNETLIGIETRPDQIQSNYKTVILVHGFGVTKEEYGMFDGLASHFAAAGILSYRFDFSGCGESEGDYAETSLSKLRDDLASILAFVKSQPHVDGSRIGIHAQSFGTSTAVALHPRINSLILMGSISRPKEFFLKRYGKNNVTGIPEIQKADGRVIKLKSQFWTDFDNHDLLSSIQKIRCSILFIHGGSDSTVPLTEMEAYYEKVNGKKEKVIITGADHGLRPYRKKMYKIAADWFKKTL